MLAHANVAAAAPMIPVSRSSCRVPPGIRSIHPRKFSLCGWIERIPGGETGKMTIWKPRSWAQHISAAGPSRAGSGPPFGMLHARGLRLQSGPPMCPSSTSGSPRCVRPGCCCCCCSLPPCARARQRHMRSPQENLPRKAPSSHLKAFAVVRGKALALAAGPGAGLRRQDTHHERERGRAGQHCGWEHQVLGPRVPGAGCWHAAHAQRLEEAVVRPSLHRGAAGGQSLRLCGCCCGGSGEREQARELREELPIAVAQLRAERSGGTLTSVWAIGPAPCSAHRAEGREGRREERGLGSGEPPRANERQTGER